MRGNAHSDSEHALHGGCPPADHPVPTSRIERHEGLGAAEERNVEPGSEQVPRARLQAGRAVAAVPQRRFCVNCKHLGAKNGPPSSSAGGRLKATMLNHLEARSSLKIRWVLFPPRSCCCSPSENRRRGRRFDAPLEEEDGSGGVEHWNDCFARADQVVGTVPTVPIAPEPRGALAVHFCPQRIEHATQILSLLATLRGPTVTHP